MYLKRNYWSQGMGSKFWIMGILLFRLHLFFQESNQVLTSLAERSRFLYLCILTCQLTEDHSADSEHGCSTCGYQLSRHLPFLTHLRNGIDNLLISSPTTHRRPTIGRVRTVRTGYFPKPLSFDIPSSHDYNRR